MQEKHIKRLVVKQLKKEFPDWRRLPKKEKKRLAKQVLDEVMRDNTSTKMESFSAHELTNTPIPGSDIIALSDMERFIEETTKCLLRFAPRRWRKHLDDPELKSIDGLLDDRVLNRLLAPEGFTASMRELFPAHYLRAELLKCLRYPEFSYRKYCKEVINRLDRKRERAFLHLPLHKAATIDHTQLSKFRAGLTISQMVNLMIYVVHLLIKGRNIAHPFRICGMDSTDLAVTSCPRPLATVQVGKKKVRIYAELDADCGKRRNKRDKSEYVVGYRLHTLVAMDPRTGANYPLFGLVAAANHHDNLFLPRLLSFAKAMGLTIQVITVDEGYIDTEQNEQMHRDYGVMVVTPASAKACVPEHVDPSTRAVYMSGCCETPMRYAGRTATGHEFQCRADGCFHAPLCPRVREVPLDSGLFGQLPDQLDGVEQIRTIRKHMERSYNLLKHREGLEPLRVKSQHSVMAVATFAQMATVILEIAGTRKTPKEEVVPKQLRIA